MAARSGAAGVFGWLTLGFLAGVAGTLAVETLMFGAKSAPPPAEAVAAPPRLQVPVSQLPAPPNPATSAKTPSDPPPATHYTSPQPEGEVADDAAAAGMTTRSTPRGGEPPN